jgi:hypothetical protein
MHDWHLQFQSQTEIIYPEGEDNDDDDDEVP